MSRAEKIAGQFHACLLFVLSSEEIAEMKKRNKAETDPLICHSHDFCDANMVMEEAFHLLGYCTPADIGEHEEAAEAMHERQCELWCEAWRLAMPFLTED